MVFISTQLNNIVHLYYSCTNISNQMLFYNSGENIIEFNSNNVYIFKNIIYSGGIIFHDE
jgi:hypothetical protein